MKQFYQFPIYARAYMRCCNLLGLKKNLNQYYYDLLYKYMKENGPEAIELLNNITERHSCNYWLTNGTLLGFYREHGFIWGDNDIDVGMYASDISVEFVNDLISNGFHLHHAIIDSKYNGFHLAFNYKNVKVDVYSFYNDDKGNVVAFAPKAINDDWRMSYRIGKFSVKRKTFPYSGLTSVDFVGVQTTIPTNVEEILSIMYGQDYMTPKQGYKAKANKNIQIEDISISHAMLCDYSTFVKLKEEGMLS